MAEAAKVIRIELRAMGGKSSGGGSGNKNKKNKKKKKKIDDVSKLKNEKQLATAAGITFATQLVSEAFSIIDTLSYNSMEKEANMTLDMSKKAISTALIGGGFLLGGPIGMAVGLAINQTISQPLSNGGNLLIRRHLDYTRATNRFYLTDFAGKGNYTFNYANSSYVNEDLQKVMKSSFYKKGGAL